MNIHTPRIVMQIMKCLKSFILIAILMLAARPLLAERVPATCIGPTATVIPAEYLDNGENVFNPVTDQIVTGQPKAVGQVIFVTVTLEQSGANQCCYEGGTLTVTLPDGTVTNITPATGIPFIC